VQLREQDFGNFQDAACKAREKSERLRFGRFFYRFPNGESGADVYDRVTIVEDHMIRDINAGRFSDDTTLVLLTHGLALRIFLMRWFHWTVDEFLNVFNPPNAAPLVRPFASPTP
jgi:broad specificity phosphatase PhoE